MKKMHYLIESTTNTYFHGDPKVEIEVILKSHNRSKLKKYLHSVYLDYLEQSDVVINGELAFEYDVKNGNLPTEYSDKLYVCYVDGWGAETCCSYQIVSESYLDKVDEI
jgi:hypothetical protein